MGIWRWTFRAGRKLGKMTAAQYKKSKLAEQLPERVRRRRR
jgi:hypothetical protein